MLTFQPNITEVVSHCVAQHAKECGLDIPSPRIIAVVQVSPKHWVTELSFLGRTSVADAWGTDPLEAAWRANVRAARRAIAKKPVRPHLARYTQQPAALQSSPVAA